MEETKTPQTKTLQDRACDAAARFMYRRGYDICTRDFDGFDIVAKDDNVLVFAFVDSSNKEEGLNTVSPVSNEQRKTLEDKAIKFLSCHDYGELAIRFDTISVCLFGEDKALLRHHTNILAAA